MGSKRSSSASSTSSTQTTSQTDADFVSGTVATGSNTITDEFNENVADVFKSLIGAIGDIAEGAGDVISQSVDAISDTKVAANAPQVQQTRELAPVLTVGAVVLGIISVVIFWKR